MDSWLLPQFQQGQQLQSYRAATQHGRVNLAVCFFLLGDVGLLVSEEELQDMALHPGEEECPGSHGAWRVLRLPRRAGLARPGARAALGTTATEIEGRRW